MTEAAVTETTAKAKPAAVVSLAAALVAAQAEMPRVKKDAENPHFNSRFMSLGGLIEATRPILNRHGLAIVQFPCVSELGPPVLGPPVLRTVLIHGPSGDRLEFETPLLIGGQNMQQLGSAITYARRYAWGSLLGIASEDDDDGQAAGTAAPSVRLITEKQRTRLRAIQKEKGVTDEHLKELVQSVAGVESSKLIPAVRYDDLVKAVELAGSSFYAPAAVDADIPF